MTGTTTPPVLCSWLVLDITIQCINAGFILGLFGTALHRVALLSRCVAPVPAEVPFCPAVLSFSNAVLPFFICCISSPIPHQQLWHHHAGSTPLEARDYATLHVCPQQIKVPFWNFFPLALFNPRINTEM